jgi:hypothetical protein
MAQRATEEKLEERGAKGEGRTTIIRQPFSSSPLQVFFPN